MHKQIQTSLSEPEYVPCRTFETYVQNSIFQNSIFFQDLIILPQISESPTTMTIRFHRFISKVHKVHIYRIVTPQNYMIIAHDPAENQRRGFTEVFSERE